MTKIKMDKQEAELAERYGFKISIEYDGRYLVIDPQQPRKRFEGGNLYAVMLQAIDTRSRSKLRLVSSTPDIDEVKKPAKPIKHGKVYAIKLLLVENENMDKYEIEQKLREQNLSVPMSTIVTVKADFQNTMSVLREAGLLKK